MATDNLSPGCLLLLIILASGLLYAQCGQARRCENAGGVYLTREWKCVTGIKELK